jgi:hypothetical protein
MASGNTADDDRFLQVSNDDTNQFTEVMKNNNTKKKTGSYLKILSEWLQRSLISTWPDFFVCKITEK